MNTRPTIHRSALAATMLVPLVVTALHAAPAVEWNFGDGNAQLDIHRPGTSNLVNLLSGTVTNQANTDLIGMRKNVLYGSYAVGGGTTQGMYTADNPGIPGEDSTWRTYLTPSGTYDGRFGPVTFLTVFKPNFSGISSTSNALLSVSTFNGSPGLSLFKNNESRMFMYTGTSSGNAAYSFTAPISWDNTAWYLVAGSASQGLPVTLYMRQLSGAGAGTVWYVNGGMLTNDIQAPIGTPDFGGPSSTPFYLGGTFAFTAPAENYGANGRFALAQVYGSYTGTQAGFEALYQSLLPEPGTAALAGVGVLLLAGARRRRR